RLIRDGVLTGEVSGLAAVLQGGRYPERRFAIHQRHYETSLVSALMAKIPATDWLVGTRFIREAAIQYVHKCPPQAPCIAEYGRDFPKFLSERPAAESLLYLHDFAELEWHVGQAAIAVQGPSVAGDQLLTIPTDVLPDATLQFQPGVHYLQVSWPIDELMELYLNGGAPDRFLMNAANLGLEVRGARGDLHINRLGAAEFIFRKSLWGARPIGDAAERALGVDDAFDPGQALASVIACRLVTAMVIGPKDGVDGSALP